MTLGVTLSVVQALSTQLEHFSVFSRASKRGGLAAVAVTRLRSRGKNQQERERSHLQGLAGSVGAVYHEPLGETWRNQ